MKIDLNARVNLDDIRRELASFTRWWVAELEGLLPAALIRQIKQNCACPVVRRMETHWLVVWPEGDRPPFALDTSGSSRDLREVIGRAQPELLQRWIDFEVPRRDVLVRTIRLPVAASGRVRKAIELQLDRLSPFRSDEVWFECRARSGTNAVGQIEVDVAVLPRTVVDRYATWLAELGLKIRSFVVPDAHCTFRVLPRMSWSNPRARSLAIAGCGILLWLLAILVAPTMREAELARQSGALTGLRSQALAASNAKSELDDLTPAIAFVEHARSRLMPLDVISRLTLALPDSMHLTNLVILGNRVTITGSTRNFQPVRWALGRIPGFRQIRLIGPLSRDAGGRQRFSLSLQVQSDVR